MGNRKSRYNRQQTPPPVGNVLHVLKVRGHERHHLVILSEEWFGVWTHFNLKFNRTVRCTAHLGRCDYDAQKVPKRWAGFLHVFSLTDTNHYAIELTALAAHRLQPWIDERGTLRGICCIAERERKTDKSPLKFSFVRMWEQESPLPPEKPVEPTLDRLWGNPVLSGLDSTL